MASQLKPPKPLPRKKSSEFSEKAVQKRDSLQQQTRRRSQGGYDCEYIEHPPKYLQAECPVCLLVLCDPHQVSCCGNSFCRVCIEVVQVNKSPCPTCNDGNFSVFQDKRLQRSLYAFHVKCPHTKEGCEWTGELGELGRHLNQNPAKEDQLVGCEFTEVDCLYCMDPFQRCIVSDHQVGNCEQRPFSCDCCGRYESSYNEVVNKHWPVCGFRPVSCPNECGVYPERQNLEHHVSKDCPLTVVTCDFHYAGCEIELSRKDMPDHLVERLALHLPLVATYSERKLAERDRLIAKFEEKLEQSRHKIEKVEKENEMMKMKQEHEIEALWKSLSEKSMEITQLREELDAIGSDVKEVQELASPSKELEFPKPKKETESRFQRGGLFRHSGKKERSRQEVASLKARYEEHSESIAQLRAKQEKDGSSLEMLQSFTGLFPVRLTVTDIEKRRRDDDSWFSKSFYTHPHGYKMCLKVAVNGRCEGAGTHVSVFAYLMRGKFDDHLRWPFQGQITVQLVNQAEDRGHHTATISFGNLQHSGMDVAGRVTDAERATDGLGQARFLPLEELGYMADKKCQYLKDDCLRFEITRVMDVDRTVQLERQCLAIESRVCIPPIDFTMSDVEQQKNENAVWYSPSFYTRQRGYRMSLRVSPNGFVTAKGTHVSVYMCLVRGDFDEHLKWPFRGDITVQLLNQREDKGHHELTTRFTDSTTDDIAGRVTSGVRANPWGKPFFISHALLGYDRTKNCQYLDGDCLHFRVTKVEMRN